MFSLIELSIYASSYGMFAQKSFLPLQLISFRFPPTQLFYSRGFTVLMQMTYKKKQKRQSVKKNSVCIHTSMRNSRRNHHC